MIIVARAIITVVTLDIVGPVAYIVELIEEESIRTVLRRVLNAVSTLVKCITFARNGMDTILASVKDG